MVGDGNGSRDGITLVSSGIDLAVLYSVDSNDARIDRTTRLEGSGGVIRSREGIARSIDIVCPRGSCVGVERALSDGERSRSGEGRDGRGTISDRDRTSGYGARISSGIDLLVLLHVDSWRRECGDGGSGHLE